MAVTVTCGLGPPEGGRPWSCCCDPQAQYVCLMSASLPRAAAGPWGTLPGEARVGWLPRSGDPCPRAVCRGRPRGELGWLAPCPCSRKALGWERLARLRARGGP